MTRAVAVALSVTRWQALAWTIAAAVVLVFAAANAHLVYVATASQPDCVPHARLGESGSAAVTAAQSACASPGRAAQRMEKRP